jgi:hypothetical protein
MAAPPCHRATDVALRVAVPRDAAGDLHAGVRSKLDGRDGVDVTDVDVVDLRPRLNDLAVEVVASVRLAPDAEVADLTDVVGVAEARPRERAVTDRDR